MATSDQSQNMLDGSSPGHRADRISTSCMAETLCRYTSAKLGWISGAAALRRQRSSELGLASFKILQLPLQHIDRHVGLGEELDQLAVRRSMCARSGIWASRVAFSSPRSRVYPRWYSWQSYLDNSGMPHISEKLEDMRVFSPLGSMDFRAAPPSERSRHAPITNYASPLDALSRFHQYVEKHIHPGDLADSGLLVNEYRIRPNKPFFGRLHLRMDEDCDENGIVIPQYLER